jgi:hypothetical protein
MVHDRISPSALTEDCDVITVSAKSANVLFHPLHRQTLVLNAKVAGTLVASGTFDLRRADEAEDIQPVID